MQGELDALRKLTEHPAKPFVCAIGGSKVADKIGVFTHLIEFVDAFCIGGGMANTFLAAEGVPVGKSLRDADLQPARDILRSLADAASRCICPSMRSPAAVSTIRRREPFRPSQWRPTT